MNDIFLPFQKSFLGELSEPRPVGESRAKILETLELLKHCLQEEADHHKLLKLSEKIQTAIAQLKILAEPMGMDSVAHASEESLKLLVFAAVTGQRECYFEKLLTYFPSVDELFQAPVSLLKAHGLSGEMIGRLSTPVSRKIVLAQAKQVLGFMQEHRWQLIRSQALSLTHTGIASASTPAQEFFPAVYFVRGDSSLLRRTKIAIMGDKLELPSHYHGLLPGLIDQLKAMAMTPVCNLSQQSALQFALTSVRRGVPVILSLGMDMVRAFEKNYRFLNYFVDQECLLVSSQLPVLPVRQTALHLFKVNMALSKIMMLFPKYFDVYEASDYSSKYWPVLNHCHQQDKVCLLYHPSESGRVGQVLQHWEGQESHLVLYRSIHELRVLLQTLEAKGHLTQAWCRKALGTLSNVTVLH